MSYNTDNVIRFGSKPSEAVRAALKSYGFRWSRAGYWYAPQSITSAAVCDCFRSASTPDAALDGLDQYVGDRQMEAACGII